MNKDEMAEILFDLRKTLKASDDLEHHQKQVMEALADEIERKITAPEANMSGDQYLLTKLKDAAKEFEADHPKLTAVVGRLSDLLARMGI